MRAEPGRRVTDDQHDRVTPAWEMTEQDRARLWQQRLFEAEAGMTNYLTHQGTGEHISEWIQIRSIIFGSIPTLPDSDVKLWQQTFFRGQALIERLLVTNYGEESLAAWAQENAKIHALAEPDRGRGATDVIDRIARQTELYASSYTVTAAQFDTASIVIDHCAIWDYRERARGCGVPITLRSPCTYCTLAMSANITAKGFVPAFQLFETPKGHGCCWQAASAAPISHTHHYGQNR